MTAEPLRSIFHLVAQGGERHRHAILLAAEIAASKGYRVEDMTRFTQNPYQPDLIIKKQDRFIDGPRRATKTTTFWIEIIDTSDPPREFVRPPAEILKIDISKCGTMDEVISTIKRSLP